VQILFPGQYESVFCLGDYQFLRYTAVARYQHLVMIAHHLLTHLAIERSGEKAALLRT
jgi:hypothetical protein